ncbi:hypothetical protein [Streptomyces sp. NPDC049040]|uniref:hypothetical protein n=1 Tax=Streptomyces sp. NPDC049040 TaxID=3365593 RepID=UPI00371182EE
MGPTYASTGPAAAKPAAAGTPAASPTPGTGTGRTTAPALSKPSKPSASSKATATATATGTGTAKKPPTAPSAAKVKALRAEAAKRAAASVTAKDTQAAQCGGPLVLDEVHACTSIPDGGSDAYTVTTTVADDLLTIQLASTSDAYVSGVLTGPEGSDLYCYVSGSGPASCLTTQPGSYTLTVTDDFGAGSYTLAVSSLRSSPCTGLTESDLAFGSTPLTGSLGAGAASSCYAFGDGAASGDLLLTDGLSYELQGTVYDSAGADVCDIGQYGDTCTLSGSAPYRLLLRDTYARAVSYSVSVNRLSHPSGCAVLAAAGFGDQDQSAGSGTIPAGGAACHTVTLPEGRLLVSLKGGQSSDGGSTSWKLYTAQGDLVCGDADDATCATLPGAGTYTLLLQNSSTYLAASYAVALVPLTATTGCAASVGTAYDLPLMHETLSSPVQVDCRPFDGAPGDRIDLMAATDVYGGLVTTIVDPAGTSSCSTATDDGSSQDGCVLTGTGPYRVITRSTNDFVGTYSMRITRLSDPAGCTPLAPQAYGTAPATSTDPCWLLQVPAAGTYDVGGMSVYRQDGTRLCVQGAASCTFPAAGAYPLVFRPAHSDETVFSPVFVSPTQTEGCVSATDTGFSSGPLRVDLSVAGVRDCLTLPTASGNGLYLVASPSEDGDRPVETVYDAEGVKQCENEYSFGVCKLTGTAPFHLVLTAPAGVYGLTIQRTGDATGCIGWPQSPFGGSTGTQVQLTTALQTACLALPANGHSTAEMFDYTNTGNRVNASVRVYDATGDQVCATVASSATTCRFAAGVGYTAVLVGTGGADTYHLVRRDVSSTASCAAAASLTVGGPSTGYTFTSALDSRCLRVQAAATDKLWLSVRTPTAAADSGADLLVVDATGTIVCWQQGASCRVSGSTSYAVIVLASGYAGTPIAAHVDTWRVGTASGWVSQCTANSLSPDGFSLRSGSLTETSTAYCGVMQVKPWQGFDVYGTDSDPASAPALGLYSSANWNGTSFDYGYQCIGSGADFDYQCSVSGGVAATQVVFVLSPGGATPPLQYTMQGVCRSHCSTPPKAADLTSVAPASGPAGTRNQVVIHGSNLTLGTEVDLAKDGEQASNYTMSTPVSVSADGTTLTVLLSTEGLAPGTYDIVLDSNGYTVGTRSPGYLPGGYTVTAASLPKWGGPAHVTDPPAIFAPGGKRPPPKWTVPTS